MGVLLPPLVKYRLNHNNDIAVQYIKNSVLSMACRTGRSKVSEVLWSQITKSIGRFITIPTECTVQPPPQTGASTDFWLRCYIKEGGVLLRNENLRLTPFNIDVLDADVQGMIYGNMVQFKVENGRSDKREYRVFEFPIPSSATMNDVEIKNLQENLCTSWIQLKNIKNASREAFFTSAAKLKVVHTCDTVVQDLKEAGATLSTLVNNEELETTRASSYSSDVAFQFRTEQANFPAWQRYTEGEPKDSPVRAVVRVKTGLLLLELKSDPI